MIDQCRVRTPAKRVGFFGHNIIHMRIILVLISCLFIRGCPVYDPPTGVLNIENNSDSAVYVYSTCDNTLPCEPKLKLFESLGDSAFDSKGNKITDTLFSPHYRINANSIGYIGVWGSPKKPRVFCEDKKIRLYFISETVIRTKDWKEICKNQMYHKKIVLSQSQLDSIGWKISYH